ncbi:hypothetical protein BDQ17DRAFT_1358554, partial [Cyathus striatus]
DTLESLSVESALTKQEVQRTVKALSHILFDLLYAKLPSLRKLTLRYNEIGLEITLQRALRKRRYAHWALEDLSVFYDWKALNTGTMRSFAKSIPSLKSFWGRGICARSLRVRDGAMGGFGCFRAHGSSRGGL